MTKKHYKCNYCNQVFGRKWNALRHSRKTHSNAADIISNNRAGFPNKSVQRYYYYKRIFDLIDKISIETPELINADLSDVFSWNRDDIKIIKIIGQLIGPYRELEELLKPIEESKRAFILSKSFESSLQAYNPVRYMNETVEVFRSIYGIKKIASNMEWNKKYYLDDPISKIKKSNQELLCF